MGDDIAPHMSTDDLRSNAHNWTLAGDVGLLSHLQKFSEEILNQVNETQGAIDNLLNKVEETSTKFNNISNQFLSLQNTQFIENRVYEDDTTDDVAVQPAIEPDNQQQTFAKYKEAVAVGLKLLDTHYEPVDVPESSDSDDDSPGSSRPVLLCPKPAYTDPLPLLIGSAEWWADDSVGLGEFQENEHSDQEISPSEEEDIPSPQVMRRTSSSSSSCLSSDVLAPTKAEQPFKPQPNAEPPPEGLFMPPKSNVFGTEDLFGNYKTDHLRSNNLFGSSESLAGKPIGRDLFSPSGSLFDEPPPVAARAPSPPKIIPNAIETKSDIFGGDAVDELFGVDSSQFLVHPKPVTAMRPTALTKELTAKLGHIAHHKNVTKDDVADVDKPVPAIRNELSKLFSNKTEELSPTPRISSLAANPQLPEEVSSKPTSNSDSSARSLKSNLSLSRKTDDYTPSVVSKPPSLGLFGEDDDDSEDDLFGVANRFSSVRNKTGTPGLFDDSPSNLFGDNDKPKIEGGLTKKDNKVQNSKSSAGPVKKYNLFADDLFADEDEGDLFAPSFGSKPPKVTFPDISDKTNSTGTIKSSTPAARGSTTATEDIFGGISKVDSSMEQTQSQSFHSSQNEENAADIAQVEDTRDLGFIESSNLSTSRSATLSRESPDNWFEPQLSSTRSAQAAQTNDTSGYRTETLDAVPDASNLARTTPSVTRISSIEQQSISRAQDSSSTMNEIQDAKSSDGLFFSESRKSDDLFGASQPSLFRTDIKAPHQSRRVQLQPDTDDDDDLFSSKALREFKKEPSPKSQNTDVVVDDNQRDLSKVTIKKTDNLFDSSIHSTGHKSLFEDDEDTSLFFDSKPRVLDNVSISSSKSSIFDETTPGRSTLPSVFANKLPSNVISKGSLFDDVDDDFDLFAPKGKSLDNKNKIKNIEYGASSKATLRGISESDDSLFTGKDTGTQKIPEVEDKGLVTPDLSSMTDKKLPEIAGESCKLKKPDNVSLLTTDSNEGGDGLDFFTNKSLEPTDVEPIRLSPNPDCEFIIDNPPISEDLTKKTAENSHSDKQRSEFIGALRPTPPNTLDIEKISDNMTRVVDQPDGEISHVAVKKTIGKLNIPMGLQINTATLLPGAKPKKVDTFVSPGGDPPPLAENQKETVVPDPASFKDTSGGLLHSALRDRARIQVKRRPQSRKARQEALRISGSDFGVSDDAFDVGGVLSPGHSVDSSGTQFYSVENTPTSPSMSNPLSPSTDGEDYFNVPSLDSNEKEEQALFDGSSVAMGNTDKSDENLLFKKPALISPADPVPSHVSRLSTISNNHSIFIDDPILEEEQFKACATEGKSLMEETSVKSTPPVPGIPAHFLESDQDDHLFGGSGASTAYSDSFKKLPFFQDTPPVIESRSPGTKMFQSVESAAFKVSSIFDDDDNDGDLFTAHSSQTISHKDTPNLVSNVNSKLNEIHGKKVNLLFGDSDEDDDIFSGAKTDISPTEKAKLSISNPVVLSEPATKPPVIDSFKDPLGLLHGD